MSFNLIVPISADKLEYENKIPYLFCPDNNGILLCVKSILGLNLEKFDNIYFTILKNHNEKYYVKDLLELQFKRLGIKASVLLLDKPTKTQAETVYNTIKLKEIKGGIFIKDADNLFSAQIKEENGIAIFPLEELNLVDPRNKSYVAIDDMYYITNIIEKRIISHYFNAGGYCFKNVDDFCNAYNNIHSYGNIYLSHIVYYLLLNNYSFRPIMVSNYSDFGTLELYNLKIRNE